VLKSRKEESNYELTILATAILAAASLSTGLCTTGAEIVVFHVSLVLALTEIASLLAATVASSMLATLLTLLATLLAAASRRLLTKILAFVTTGTTHVSLEIVVLHSVICHVCLLPCVRQFD
jgi:hypothetical protein